MYSQTTGMGVLRAPTGSHNRALKREPSLRTIHSLSITSTSCFSGSPQRFSAGLSAAAPSSAIAIEADSSAAERSTSRREIVIGMLLPSGHPGAGGGGSPPRSIESPRIPDAHADLSRRIDEFGCHDGDIDENRIYHGRYQCYAPIGNVGDVQP